MPIDQRTIKWDAPAAPDPKAVKWDAPAAEEQPQNDLMHGLQTVGRYLKMLTPAGIASNLGTSEGRQDLLDSAAGGLRGAGSIGATLMYPIDKATDLIKDDRGPNITGLVTGQQPLSRNEERRRDMTEGLQMAGANPDSGMFQGGKLATEVAGTAGTGGAIANTVRALPMAANVATKIEPLLAAIETGGMTAGGVNGARGLALRTAGGAINGGASAGLVDPHTAGAGALVGGALPGGLQVAGAAGTKVGNLLRGAEQAPEVTQAVQAAREAGYVIPPSQVKPSLSNRILEGFSGKLTTAQNASARNQAVTNNLAAKALGLPEGTVINHEVLDALREEAGQAYGAVSKLGKFDATRANLPSTVAVDETNRALMGGKTLSVDAGEVVRAWKQANADATAWYRAYARDANPETLAKAKGFASQAKQIDDFLFQQVAMAQKAKPGKLIADLSAGKITPEEFLQQTLANGQIGDLGKNLKDARVRIAKSYSVEDALNGSTGSVDARRLAKQVQKGKPLSGELLDAAEFAGRFPKAAQAPEAMGSLPQTSPLDWGAALAASVATGNPLPMAAVMARPAARKLVLSGPVQNRLAAQAPSESALARLFANPAAVQLGYRAAPVALTER